MPSAEAMTRSSGVVTKPRTRSAAAPTYTVVMVITAFSLRGYWRTLSERIACTPAITIRRLTTRATTGRRMNRSVNFIGCSLVHGLRRHLGARSQIVLHHDADAVAELEGAAADDGLSGRQTGSDRDEVSAPLSQPDELLVRDQSGIAGRILLLLDGEDRIAVRRVEDGGGGDHQHRPLLGREHVDVDEHARAQAAVGVREGGPQADVAGGHVDLRVDGGQRPLPVGLREDVGPQLRLH